MTSEDGLVVLAVDDEPPALNELVYQLRQLPAVCDVVPAGSAPEALALLQSRDVDAVFLDIRMPGLDGLALARVLGRFANPPAVVFVTAYDAHAVEAFEISAVDYVLKPIRPQRLEQAVERLLRNRAPAATAEPAPDETIAVELGGSTRYVKRSEVVYAEAQRDYVRLHTRESGHLVRVPLNALEERWADAGFLRVHRRYLVNGAYVVGLHGIGGHLEVELDGQQRIPVSRRYGAAVREALVRRHRIGRGAPGGAT